jgi:hypothetical protein
MASGQTTLALPRRLRDFDFGFASADTEAADRPELLRGGFLDHLGMEEEAKDGRRFIFLGYKGSGKSALGERLVLLAEGDPCLFVRMINIADVSFQSFSQIMQQGIEPEARYPTVWSWLVLLQLFDSFVKDNGSNMTDSSELWLAAETLKDMGLLPDPNLAGTIRTTLEKSFSIKIAGFLDFGAKTSTKQTTDLPFFIERLKLNAGLFRSQSKHIVVIDGFDDLLRRRTLQYDALGALIFETHRLNIYFAQRGVPAKIVLLCRTDLFERLPGPNNNKIRQDYAVNLEWINNEKNYKHAPLVELINRRASLKTGFPVDVFDLLLPALEDTKDKINVRAHLLEHTRHVPRDMVMLFRSLQQYSGDGRMTLGQLFDALASYSRTYFVNEMKDELDGQVSSDDVLRAFRLFTSVRKRIVKISDLESRAVELKYPGSFDLRLVLRLLFDCSAIGNARTLQTFTRDIQFKFRNRFSELNEMEYIVFHRALWKGLDLH